MTGTDYDVANRPRMVVAAWRGGMAEQMYRCIQKQIEFESAGGVGSYHEVAVEKSTPERAEIQSEAKACT